MVIKRITARNFGSVSFYDAVLTPELNLIETRFVPELSAMIQLLLCNKMQWGIPGKWIHKDTRLVAEICLENTLYAVEATVENGQLKLSVADAQGNAAIDKYCSALSHCPEQDAVESFDGRDRTLPMRLYLYRNYKEISRASNFGARSEGVTNTKTFQAYLYRYMKTFSPERIHVSKKYLAVLDHQGIFQAVCPDFSGELHLSTTEEKLFHYICFLNIAAFWESIETLRDLHHVKKPLVIKNFLEFLDESTDISSLIQRTLQLNRQIIVLTPHLSEEQKEIWMKENTSV